MNQKGELTLFTIIFTLGLSSLLIIYTLQLAWNFSIIKKRSSLFICAKKVKILIKKHSEKITKSNWIIKNSKSIKTASFMLPGFQVFGTTANQLKETLKKYQDLELLLFKTQLTKLHLMGCKISKNSYSSPFQVSGIRHLRNKMETTIPREKIWKTSISNSPFTIYLSLKGIDQPSLHPQIFILSEDKMENFLFKWQFFSWL
jgi:hypothetical protein